MKKMKTFVKMLFGACLFLTAGCGISKKDRKKMPFLNTLQGNSNYTADVEKSSAKQFVSKRLQTNNNDNIIKNSELSDSVNPSSSVQWVQIPGGKYIMGQKFGDFDVHPVHAVNVQTFYMTKTEITNDQYALFLNTNGNDCSGKKCVRTDLPYLRIKGSNEKWMALPKWVKYPVVEVTWYGARSYCNWIGGRLPSEAEWEYAARNGGKYVFYPWENDGGATCYYAVMSDVSGLSCGKGENENPWQVCSKTPGNTEQGLCDMLGNVDEWLEDDEHYNYKSAPIDGSAWIDKPRAEDRICRGGSWASEQDTLNVFSRSGSRPGSTTDFTGFRCARSKK